MKRSIYTKPITKVLSADRLVLMKIVEKIDNMNRTLKNENSFLKKTSEEPSREKLTIRELMNRDFPNCRAVEPDYNPSTPPTVHVFGSLSSGVFFGGLATLFIAGAKLANELGYNLQIVQTAAFSPDNSPLGFLRENGVIIEPERYSTIDLSGNKKLPMSEEDIFIVSGWWDAAAIKDISRRNKFIYLIQDFEPIFYNNSDNYVFANRTYFAKNFIPLINTSMLAKYFEKNNYPFMKDAVIFEPAPAKNIKMKEPKGKKRTMFLYGRPSTARNLFYTSVSAINWAMRDSKMQQFDWEIFSAGDDSVPDIELDNGIVIKNKGKMALDEYYKFMTKVNLTVSPMMAPHPNYPTLELANLGGVVVTTKWETKQNLDLYSKNILMAELDADDLAKKIVEAATLDKKIRRDNFAKNNINTSWDVSLDKPIKEVVKKLHKRV